MAETAEKTMVKMTDGREVGFNKAQRLVRNSTIADDGTVTTVLDFLNGQTRKFVVAPTAPNYARFAATGVENKIGNQIGNEKDIDDAVMSVDDLIKRLNDGEWYVGRAPGSFSGASILAKALIEASGKTGDEIKAFLGSKSHAEKLALRTSPQIKPIIERLEAEKAANSKTDKPSVDTGALLGELGVGSAAQGSKEPHARAHKEKVAAE